MKLCKDCKHGIKAGEYHCGMWADPVDGNAVLCSDARSQDGPCGPTGIRFERRQNASAIADQARVFITRNGETEYIGTLGEGAKGNERLGGAQPVAESSKAKAYHPQDINLEEWKRDHD